MVSHQTPAATGQGPGLFLVDFPLLENGANHTHRHTDTHRDTHTHTHTEASSSSHRDHLCDAFGGRLITHTHARARAHTCTEASSSSQRDHLCDAFGGRLGRVDRPACCQRGRELTPGERVEPQANKGSALPGGSSSSAPGPAASTCPRAPGSEILVAPLLPAQRQIFTQGWAPEGTGVKAWGQRRTHRAAGRGGAQAGRAALSQRPPACRREMLLHSQWAGRAGLPPLRLTVPLRL